jgi:hypothetical protein
VLRGIEDGDPAVLDATEPRAIGPGAGYDQDDLASDLGLEPGDPALRTAASAYADAFADSFWTEVERAAREHTSYVAPGSPKAIETVNGETREKVPPEAEKPAPERMR